MRSKCAAGFTLLELLVVMVILMIAATLGIPALQKMIVRQKLEGFLRTVGIHMQVARQESIKSGNPVVVEPRTGQRELLLFADVDDDGSFTPNASAVPRTVDYEIARLPLPSGNSPSANIEFKGPNGGADAVVGFAGDIAVFDPDGSIRSEGAFRFGDSRGNILEVKIGPTATARVEIRKYNPNIPGCTPPDCFFPQGRDENNNLLWEWSY
jgi:prepilin-type N-terminal cleavage/methylation domain-containing protein